MERMERKGVVDLHDIKLILPSGQLNITMENHHI